MRYQPSTTMSTKTELLHRLADPVLIVEGQPVHYYSIPWMRASMSTGPERNNAIHRRVWVGRVATHYQCVTSSASDAVSVLQSLHSCGVCVAATELRVSLATPDQNFVAS